MLLEALAGATYDEITDDYMTTYENYYGITKKGDPDRYRIIKENNIDAMLEFLTGVPKEDFEKADIDYVACAQEYLKKGGMSNDDIERLKVRILE